jgi:hypothetical protein
MDKDFSTAMLEISSLGPLFENEADFLKLTSMFLSDIETVAQVCIKKNISIAI